jgi:hypothetical protein
MKQASPDRDTEKPRTRTRHRLATCGGKSPSPKVCVVLANSHIRVVRLDLGTMDEIRGHAIMQHKLAWVEVQANHGRQLRSELSQSFEHQGNRMGFDHNQGVTPSKADSCGVQFGPCRGGKMTVDHRSPTCMSKKTTFDDSCRSRHNRH